MGTAPTMMIEENLALAARRGQRRGLKWGITPLERADYKELLRTLDLGLEDRLTSKVGLLSGCSTSTPRRSTPRRPPRCSRSPTRSCRRIGSRR